MESALKKILLIGIPLAVLGGLVGWRIVGVRAKAAELKTQGAARRGTAPPVEVATAGPRTIERLLTLTADAEAPFTVGLAPKAAGRIVALNVREGDRVRAGQILVRIDPAEIEGQVLGAEAALAEARARLAQSEATAGSTEIGLSSAIGGARATVSRTQAASSQAQRDLQAQVAAANAAVADLDARISAAKADARAANAAIGVAVANLTNARTRFDRVNGLYKGGFIAAQDVDDARAIVGVETANVGAARAVLASRNDTVTALSAQRKAAVANVGIARRGAEAAIATAAAEVRGARAALRAADANRAQGPAYRQGILALQSAVTSAQAQVRQAQARRADANLASTIDGTVTERVGDPGGLASPGTPVLTVQYLRWLYVNAPIPLEESARVRQGQEATIVFDAIPGKTFRGRIAQLNKAADPQSRRFDARIRLENADETIRPGMFGRVTLVAESQTPSVVVPRDAVDEGPRGATVTVLDSEDKAVRRPVKLGARDAKFVAITEGVKAGERVVTLAYSPVREGQKVRIGKPEDAPGGAQEGSGGQGRPRNRAQGDAPQGAAPQRTTPQEKTNEPR